LQYAIEHFLKFSEKTTLFYKKFILLGKVARAGGNLFLGFPLLVSVLAASFPAGLASFFPLL